MLGAVSRAAGVQSYSESPKKSLSLELMREVMRDEARVWVLLKDVADVRWIVPPRWAELGTDGEVGVGTGLGRNGTRVGEGRGPEGG